MTLRFALHLPSEVPIEIELTWTWIAFGWAHRGRTDLDRSGAALETSILDQAIRAPGVACTHRASPAHAGAYRRRRTEGQASKLCVRFSSTSEQPFGCRGFLVSSVGVEASSGTGANRWVYGGPCSQVRAQQETWTPPCKSPWIAFGWTHRDREFGSGNWSAMHTPAQRAQAGGGRGGRWWSWTLT